MLPVGNRCPVAEGRPLASLVGGKPAPYYLSAGALCVGGSARVRIRAVCAGPTVA